MTERRSMGWSTLKRAETGALTVELGNLDAYRDLCDATRSAPAQRPLWVESWAACSGNETLVVTLHHPDGTPAFGLPLEIVDHGPFRVARFMGGSHANGNLAPALDADGRAIAPMLLALARQQRPAIDLILLERLAESLDEAPNPLGTLPRLRSPNTAFAIDLSGGFESLIATPSGKRKLKKHRSRGRRLSAAGGLEMIHATSPSEVNDLLDGFFAMKATRLQAAGVANVFGPAHVQSFFRQLFTAALDAPERPFSLSGLQVDGKLRAVNGHSRCGRSRICEFGAISEDELTVASPGQYLFFENIRRASDEGDTVYDFSVGDEPFKRLWSDIERSQFDVHLPATPGGHILSQVLKTTAWAKRSIKDNHYVWNKFKELRRRAAA